MTVNPQGPVRVVPERTIGPVDLDRLRSIIHSATHHVLPFAEVPMTRPFSIQERAGMQVEIADRIIADIGQAAAPSPAAPEGVGENTAWWNGVIGEGRAHEPSGELRSIKHMHPAMVKPIYEAHKGTAVADVIAGLIFSLAITQNREQFLVQDANERRKEAEERADLFEARLNAAQGLPAPPAPLADGGR